MYGEGPLTFLMAASRDVRAGHGNGSGSGNDIGRGSGSGSGRW